MIALVLAVIAYWLRSLSADTASAWRLPRYANNWSCSRVNSRGLIYAISTERFGLPFAVCGRGG
jgi:hypothetical protein